jgi:hypothetical protein
MSVGDGSAGGAGGVRCVDEERGDRGVGGKGGGGGVVQGRGESSSASLSHRPLEA